MEKKCKYCVTMIPKEASVCPHCMKKQGMSSLSKLFVLLIIILVVSGIIGIILGRKDSANVFLSTKWEYTESKNEMTGKVAKVAFKSSVNTVNFYSPYQGVQHGTIMVIAEPNIVIFYVEKGQVVCRGGRAYGTCRVQVKFDDGEAIYVDAKELGDTSTTIAFTETSFIKKLKESNKLMIEVEVYHNGNPVFTFDVGGLDQKRL